MILQASRLRELENPSLGVERRVELCCELSKEFEDKGEYEKARRVLADYWQRLDQPPRLPNLEPSTTAEILLRIGVLTGAIGSKTQFTDAQEKAKDLITESLNIFRSIGHQKKIAETQTELALCYWRTGEVNEARDLLKDALSQQISDFELKAKAVLRLAIVERMAARYRKALRILTESTPLFHEITNETLKGSYHVTLGSVLENLWESKRREDYLDRALIEYTAASYHFEVAQHRSYWANVENNLGFLYFKINCCEEAHEHLDHARRILVSLKDIGTIAQVDETRACVFLKQGRLKEAERAARSSVNSLEKSDRHALLAEALITHGRALARIRSYSASLAAFRRAIALAERIENTNQASEAALAAFQEIGDNLVAGAGPPLTSGRALHEEIRSFERDVIKLALETAQGSVTRAARSLGMSYQALSYVLETRQKELLKERTPVRRRPRREA